MVALARAALVLVGLAGCATPLPPPAAQATSPPGILSPAMLAGEVVRLRDAFAGEVAAEPLDAAEEATWIDRTRLALAAVGAPIARPQLIVAVDRNPAVQRMALLLAQPGPDGWQVIGGGKVSTGQRGRRGYYITPTGVFAHDGAILDYRALGTFNENHIRGLGRRGMRVWDFGWQRATKGWRDDGEEGDIRLLVHATDPDLLEPRLGRPASQGCVRISARMNRFLDRHGVLDAEYDRIAADDVRFAALLGPAHAPTPLAGSLLVVFDTTPPR